MKHHIAIVGAGIIGMTNAILLLENDFKVTVFSKDKPLETNSDAAVATWYAPDDSKPFLQQCCLESLSEFYEKIKKEPLSGVEIISEILYFSDEEAFKKSVWAKETLKKLVNLSNPPTQQIKISEFPFSVLVHVPLINPTIYRSFMLEKFEKLGGKLNIKKVASLDELTDTYDIVINSAGWEAKYLTQDSSVHPVRGQTETMRMTKDFKNDYSLNIEALSAYIVFRPSSFDCVAGTTYQMGDSYKGIRETDKQEIFKKVSAFFPSIKGVEAVSKAGIRCERSDVRIETEEGDNAGKKSLIVHCYGHGGSGFSASWGSAFKVLEHCKSFSMNPNFGPTI